MEWHDYVSIFSGPIGIAVFAVVAIYTIRKTAIENRISNIHTELCECLVDSVFLISQVLSLLDDVAKQVVYQSIPEEEIIETAYTRYWREIGNLSKQFRHIQAKQRLVFPKKLYDGIQNIIKMINQARGLVRQAAPHENHLPDTEELQKVVDKAVSAYRDFLHESRKYLGTARIKPLTLMSELPIKANENAEPREKVS